MQLNHLEVSMVTLLAFPYFLMLTIPSNDQKQPVFQSKKESIQETDRGTKLMAHSKL